MTTEELLQRMQTARELLMEGVNVLVKAAQALGEPQAQDLVETRTVFGGMSGHSMKILHQSTRYPCSATCTHDDVATPGHPERVKERSEAVRALSQKVLPGPDVVNGGPGTRGPVQVVSSHARTTADAYAEGAEAMRAACLEAGLVWLQERGASLGEQADFKSTIEGATP